MSESFTIKEQIFILLLLGGLFVTVAIMPIEPTDKLFPLILILLVAGAYLYLLRLLRNVEGKNDSLLEERILEKIEGKKYDPFKENAVSWFFTCLHEALKETRPLFFNFTREKSLNPLAFYIRTLRRHLNPNWFCSTCGKQVRYAFKPILDCVVDSLLDENAGFLASAPIGCQDCDPFFKEEQKEPYYNV